MSLSIQCLPHDVLLLIFSLVASHSAKEFGNLQRVSKSFRRICNESYVLRRVSFNGYCLDPWIPYAAQYNKFLELCSAKGNPDAKYRKGILQYFHPDATEEEQDEGLKMVAYAAEEGIEAAQFFYGLILICLGGENKRKGFAVLTPLRKAIDQGRIIPKNDIHQRNLCHLRTMGCYRMVKCLRNTYVRDGCNCVGLKEGLYETPGNWRELGRRWFNTVHMLYNYNPSVTCEWSKPDLLTDFIRPTMANGVRVADEADNNLSERTFGIALFTVHFNRNLYHYL